MSDVEEVARAICTARGKNPDAQLIGGYHGPRRRQWEGYIAEATAALATLKPDTSPVCVEVRELGWRLDLLSNGASDIYLASGLGFRFLYGVQKSGPRENPWRAWDVDWEITGETFHPTLEAAQAACQADFERRVLELINARSVADVRAECADQIANLAAEAERCGLTDKTEHFRIAEREVRYGARALTEGEG